MSDIGTTMWDDVGYQIDGHGISATSWDNVGHQIDGYDINATSWDNVGYQIDGHDISATIWDTRSMVMKVGFRIGNVNWFECEFEEAVYKSI